MPLLLGLPLPLGWKLRLLFVFPCLGRFCGPTICTFLCFFAAVARSREPKKNGDQILGPSSSTAQCMNHHQHNEGWISYSHRSSSSSSSTHTVIGFLVPFLELPLGRLELGVLRELQLRSHRVRVELSRRFLQTDRAELRQPDFAAIRFGSARTVFNDGGTKRSPRTQPAAAWLELLGCPGAAA